MTNRRIIPLDLALPFWRYGAMFELDSCAFLLDSAMDPGRLGRYSFIGGNPSALLCGRRAGRDDLAFDLSLTTWRTSDGKTLEEPVLREWSGDPFSALRDLQAEYRPENSSDLPPGGHFAP